MGGGSQALVLFRGPHHCCFRIPLNDSSSHEFFLAISLIFKAYVVLPHVTLTDSLELGRENNLKEDSKETVGILESCSGLYLQLQF